MAIATALLASQLITAASADVLEDIKARGTLIVGVKADYKPFGFRDPSGAIIGLEPDLAADVAGRLGVKLELVPVVSANRMEFLNQGKIDLMIATMSDKPERRKIVQVIEPLYYSDAINVLLKRDPPVSTSASSPTMTGRMATTCPCPASWRHPGRSP
jgi:polar amino acid transport system substrate-binding protein